MKFFGKTKPGGGRPISPSGKKAGKSPTSFDYKDPLSLYNFIEGGKIAPARVTGLSHSRQRALSNAVKKARCLGLLPSSSQTFDDFPRPEPVSPKPFSCK